MVVIVVAFSVPVLLVALLTHAIRMVGLGDRRSAAVLDASRARLFSDVAALAPLLVPAFATAVGIVLVACLWHARNQRRLPRHCSTREVADEVLEV